MRKLYFIAILSLIFCSTNTFAETNGNDSTKNQSQKDTSIVDTSSASSVNNPSLATEDEKENSTFPLDLIIGGVALLIALGALGCSIYSITTSGKKDDVYYHLKNHRKDIDSCQKQIQRIADKQKEDTECIKDYCNTQIDESKRLILQTIASSKPKHEAPDHDEPSSEAKQASFIPVVKYGSYIRSMECFNGSKFSDSQNDEFFKITITSPISAQYELVAMNGLNPNIIADIRSAVECDGYDDWRSATGIINVTSGCLERPNSSDDYWSIKKKAVVKLER